MAESATTKLKSLRLKGLEKVEVAPLMADGTTGEAWVEIGDTVPDSFVINKAEDTVTEEFIEESDEAIDEITSQKGVRTVTWQTKNIHPDVFKLLAGGTADATTQAWIENPMEEAKELSVRATSKTGIQVVFNRVKLRINGDLNFQKSALAKITISGKQLTPTKAEEAGYKIIYPDATIPAVPPVEV